MNPLLPCLALALLGQVQLPLRSPEAVAAAERAFSERAAKEGTPAAFLEYLTEEALVFTPRAENGPAVQRAQKADGSRLSWAPEFVELAASGDFALSTGPWQWRPPSAAAPAAQGHFLSLWVLRGDRWRVLLDVGTPHPEQGTLPLRLRKVETSPQPGARDALASAWKAFDRAGMADLKVALDCFATRDLRVYRKGQPLREGARPAGPGAGTTWTEGGCHVAASADLAVRWGLRETASGVSSAVQVWRREGVRWGLAMDVDLPHAEGKQ
jgi:ketosteroid isomerase-like protein